MYLGRKQLNCVNLKCYHIEGIPRDLSRITKQDLERRRVSLITQGPAMACKRQEQKGRHLGYQAVNTSSKMEALAPKDRRGDCPWGSWLQI